MTYLIFILALCFFIVPVAALRIALLARNRVIELTLEVDLLRREMAAKEKQSPPAPKLMRDAPQAATSDFSFTPGEERSGSNEDLSSKPDAIIVQRPAPRTHSYAMPRARLSAEGSDNLEKRFGMKLPVWVGGIALIFAGFYMVKYSIEAGLLSPEIRVVLGCLFGLVLLTSGDICRRRMNTNNGMRIGQSLTGAGIAVLYGALYSATSLYGLLSPVMGFMSMAVVTAAAVVLSLVEGFPIAILGLVGGFITPALVGSAQPNGPLLFTYLLIIFVSFHVLIRHRQWWFLSPLSLLFAYAWTGLWIVTQLQPGDSLWLVGFVIGVSVTVIFTVSRRSTQSEASSPGTDPLFLNRFPLSAIHLTALGGGLLLTAVIVHQAGFTLLDWGLLGLISLGCFALAWFRGGVYDLVPPASMILNMVLLLAWDTELAHSWTLVMLGFGLLNIGGGYLLFKVNPRDLLRTLHLAIGCLGYFLIAYYRLEGTAYLGQAPGLWAVVAGLLALLPAKATQEAWQLFSKSNTPDRTREGILAILAVCFTSLVTLGGSIELAPDYRPMFLALELLALAWIHSQAAFRALEWLCGALATLFTLLVVPSIIDSFLYIRLFPSGYTALTPSGVWLAIHALVGAGCLLAAGRLLRSGTSGRLAEVFETATLGLVLMGGHLLVNMTFSSSNADFERALRTWRTAALTNLYFGLATAGLYCGNRLSWRSFINSGLIILALALLRLAVIVLPEIDRLHLGTIPLINALAVIAGLPLAWVWFCALESRYLSRANLVTATFTVFGVLAFLYMNLNVRQFFHGDLLGQGPTTNAELYTYSVSWLAFGIALLFQGVLRQSKACRYASLVIMIITVAKVFLYDASELTGLFRVGSFLGLGLSLFVLSWFYSRFVFREPLTATTK